MRNFGRLLFSIILSFAIVTPAYAERVVANATGGGNAGSFILDNLSGTYVGAYSIRQLTASYSGVDMNIRRTSDNAMQDIGFVQGKFDIATATNFCAATTCFITRWNDQSGNANDVSQATAANQPQLVLSDPTLNDWPSIQFTDNGTQCLVAANNLFLTSIYNIHGFVSAVTSTLAAPIAIDRIMIALSGSTESLRFNIGGSTALVLDKTFSVSHGSWVTPALGLGPHSFAIDYDGSSSANTPVISFDNVVKTLSPVLIASGTPTVSAPLQMGLFGDPSGIGRAYPGNVTELIVYKNSIPTTGQKNNLYQNQKAFYTLP